MAEDGITIRGVYERSDVKVRRQEGMELYKGFIGEEFDTKVPIVENGVKYIVDVKDGQKTGFFLDQKYNRLAVQRFCKDAGCSYARGFYRSYGCYYRPVSSSESILPVLSGDPICTG